jgi:hypothetical protein
MDGTAQFLNDNQGIVRGVGIAVSAIGIVVTIAVAYWKHKKQGKPKPIKPNTDASQTFVKMEEGATLSDAHFAGNLMVQNTDHRTQNSALKKSLTVARQKALAHEGSNLSNELFQFAREREEIRPDFGFSSPNVTDEERRQVGENKVKKQDEHSRESKSLYGQKFLGRVAAFLDEVQEIGIEVDRTFLQTYSHLVGPDPIQEIAKQIAILTGRIKRSGTEDLH